VLQHIWASDSDRLAFRNSWHKLTVQLCGDADLLCLAYADILIQDRQYFLRPVILRFSNQLACLIAKKMKYNNSLVQIKTSMSQMKILFNSANIHYIPPIKLNITQKFPSNANFPQ